MDIGATGVTAGGVADRSTVRIEFEPTASGLEIVDSTDRRRYTLYTPTPVAPEPAPIEGFHFPVDAARSIDTTAITLPTVVAVIVRDAAGAPVTRTAHFDRAELDAGRYHLELSAPIKLHLVVDAAVTIVSDARETEITFDDVTTVRVGVQSKHEQPVDTVTTPPDPSAIMRAISTFSSALKTTSPERSYPTFRGHPPAVELGESLEIPSGLAPPDAGVRIIVPPELRYTYVVGSLAYYLGATVEPGNRPELVTDAGFHHPLDGPHGFETAVERTLKQTFLLDCVTRTAGLYRIDLHERSALQAVIEPDLADLYERPLADRLETYLSIPFETVEPHLPEWKLTTHVSPVPASIETLPYVVNDLAVVRTPDDRANAAASFAMPAADSFDRDSLVRSAAGVQSTEGSFVELETTDSIEHAWVGEETPIGVSEATAEAYQNRFRRRPSADSIDITVVCNDPEMDEERDLVDQAYGSRFELPFDVDIYRNLDRTRLQAVLETESDLLHYIGHIEPEGFRCADGLLDVASLDRVGVDAFVLNACQSYDQGKALLHLGAIGGIATLSTVINSGAVRIGSAVARLLNCGFPLRAALDIAKGESLIGGSYIVIGDGGLTVAQAESGTPYLVEIAPAEDHFEVTVRTYPTTTGGMGGVFMPIIQSNDKYYLNSGDINTFELPAEEVQDFLALEDVPVQIDGELRWSSDIRIEELR